MAKKTSIEMMKLICYKAFLQSIPTGGALMGPRTKSYCTSLVTNHTTIGDTEVSYIRVISKVIMEFLGSFCPILARQNSF